MLRYRCNVFFTLKTCRSIIHEKHSIQQFCSKQLHSHVWTISLIMEPFSHIFVQVESYKRVFAFLFDALPVSQDTVARYLSFKYSTSFLSLSYQHLIEYGVPNIYCVLFNHKNKPPLRKRHLNL